MSELGDYDAVLAELDAQLGDFSEDTPRRPKNDFGWQSVRGERDAGSNSGVIRREVAKVPGLAEFICTDLVTLFEAPAPDEDIA